MKKPIPLNQIIKKMGVFDIPALVYEKHLWPLLKWNDLLRMRRVCRVAKFAIKDYMKGTHFSQTVPEIEIDESEKSIDKFLRMELPVTKIYINNEIASLVYYDFWKTYVKFFLRLYKDKITHLRLNVMCRIPARSELEFLDSLPNLKSLTVMNLEAVPPYYWEPLRKFEKEYRRTLPPGAPFSYKDIRPKIFDTLQEIDIGMESIFDSLEHSKNLLFTSLLFTNEVCPMLESVKVPFLSKRQDAHELIDVSQSFVSDLHSLHAYFAIVRSQLSGYKNEGDTTTFRKVDKLKRMSFEHFYYPDQTLEMQRRVDQFAAPEFLYFLDTVTNFRKVIQLEFVNAIWFMMASRMQTGRCIVSMVNVHPAAIDYMQSENLEKVVINSASSCVLTSASGHLYQKEADATIEVARRPDWPKLKTLIVNVNSDYLTIAEGRRLNLNGEEKEIYFPKTPVSDLFTFLFKGVSTNSLSHMSISFQNVRKWVPSLGTVNEIVQSCPNVKHLNLSYWNGTNKSLTRFWEGMPGLEAVTLRRCEGLGNVAFVGKDIENPVFLKLKKLKSLTLKELDHMPKITDTLFRLVLNHIRLKTLILHSIGPIKSITVEGIRSLQYGPFAEFIETFPFSNWSLSNCSQRAFRKLSKEFRSYNMV